MKKMILFMTILSSCSIDDQAVIVPNDATIETNDSPTRPERQFSCTVQTTCADPGDGRIMQSITVHVTAPDLLLAHEAARDLCLPYSADDMCGGLLCTVKCRKIGDVFGDDDMIQNR